MVVPTRIQTKWPNNIHDTKAPHSSALNGRVLLIEYHLNRTLSLSQNPVAAARSSSLVGRCGIFGKCGRWRYFETDSERLSCPSCAPFLRCSASLFCPSGCDDVSLGAGVPPFSSEFVCFHRRCIIPAAPNVLCGVCFHACLVRRLIVPCPGDSAAEWQLLAMLLVEGLEVLRPRRRPPEHCR